jgi:hypothetical protein
MWQEMRRSYLCYDLLIIMTLRQVDLLLSHSGTCALLSLLIAETRCVRKVNEGFENDCHIH